MKFLKMINLFGFWRVMNNSDKIQNYNIVNLTELKRTRINKILTNVQLFCFFTLTILTTIYIIENFY